MNTKDFQTSVIILLVGILITVIVCFGFTIYQIRESETNIKREIICQKENNSLPECKIK